MVSDLQLFLNNLGSCFSLKWWNLGYPGSRD